MESADGGGGALPSPPGLIFAQTSIHQLADECSDGDPTLGGHPPEAPVLLLRELDLCAHQCHHDSAFAIMRAKGRLPASVQAKFGFHNASVSFKYLNRLGVPVNESFVVEGVSGPLVKGQNPLLP